MLVVINELLQCEGIDVGHLLCEVCLDGFIDVIRSNQSLGRRQGRVVVDALVA